MLTKLSDYSSLRINARSWEGFNSVRLGDACLYKKSNEKKFDYFPYGTAKKYRVISLDLHTFDVQGRLLILYL